MAAKFHLAEYALALHLFLQHPEGLVDIVVTDENLHAAFLFDRVIDGSNRQRRSGHWRTENVQFGCRRHPRYEPTSILKLCQPMGTRLPIGRNEDFGTSPFFGQLFGQANACLYTK